jgi:tRNA (guanosine-2'-O-)-methyltransferase
MDKQRALIEFLSAFLSRRRLAKIKRVLKQRSRHISVVLEDIFQSQNASAVLRSCECFGVQDVHIIENRYSFELNPDVVMGASKWLSLHRYNGTENNTIECLSRLKANGFQLIAATPHKDEFSPATLPLSQKTALLFGTEMEGLTEEAKQMADGYMCIPMFGFTESFNISVSVAISLYHLTNRMKDDIKGWRLGREERDDLMLEWLSKSVRNPEKLIRHFESQWGKPKGRLEGE